MPPADSVPSATVTDLATARRTRTRATDATPSPAAKPVGRRPANRRFDAEKVARLKAAIAEGRYKIDPGRVADRFIEHERNS